MGYTPKTDGLTRDTGRLEIVIRSPRERFFYRNHTAKVRFDRGWGIGRNTHAEITAWCADQWGYRRWFPRWVLQSNGTLRVCDPRMTFEFKLRWHGVQMGEPE